MSDYVLAVHRTYISYHITAENLLLEALCENIYPCTCKIRTDRQEYCPHLDSIIAELKQLNLKYDSENLSAEYMGIVYV